MPILTLQRRLREAGRIRIGQRVTKNGRSYPGKLSTFRITARDRAVVDAAAELYGGTAQPWASPDGQEQFEVITNTAALEVVVPPTAMAFSQFFESWTGGGCVRRCDGERELISDQPCLCDPENRECAPHSRLSLILPDLPAVGLFRLDTSGYNAAEELAGAVDLALQFAARGTYLPAELRLEQREKRRPGEQVKKFAVPILDLKVSMREIGQAGRGLTGARLDLESGELVAIERAAPVAIEAPAVEQAAHFTPVSAPAAPPAPSIAEQLETAHKPAPKAPRANAAAPIPPTGLAPRGAPATDLLAEDGPAAGDVTPHTTPAAPAAAPRDKPPAPAEDGGGADPERAPAAVEPPVDAAGEVPGSAPPVAVTVEQAQDIARMCRHAGVPRAAFLAAWSVETRLAPMISSARDVPADRMVALRERLLDVFHGRTTLWVDPETASVKLVDHYDDQSGEVVQIPTAAYWDARLQHVKGVGPVKLVRMARKIATNLGIADADRTIGVIGDIPAHDHLRKELNEWLLTHVDADAA